MSMVNHIFCDYNNDTAASKMDNATKLNENSVKF